MKKKSGFTVVELIVSFSLTMVIVVFLFEIVISLKNLYDVTVLKTELLQKQALISDAINKQFVSKTINNIYDCGDYCVQFYYTDNTSDTLKINYNDNSIEFSNYKTNLPNETYIKNAKIEVQKTATFSKTSNNSILIVNIEIENDKITKEDYDILVIYQFNDMTYDLQAIDINK